MKVFLNQDDLLLAARFLGFSNTKQLFENNYLIIDNSRNGAPLPRLRFSKGAAGCCPFLENRLDERAGQMQLTGLCRLHPHYKPLVCHLAPLYREIDLAAGTELWGQKRPLPGCPGSEAAFEAASDARPVAADASGLSGFDRIFDGGYRPPEELSGRLKAEHLFFKKLSERLKNNSSDIEIIEEFYYLDIK